MRKGQAIKNIALVFLSLALSLVIIETFLAWKPELQARRPLDNIVFCTDPPQRMQPHERLGWTAMPESAFFVQKSEADGWKVHINNTEGFRDLYNSGERNVIVLGDLFTEGNNVNNDEAFPHLLDLWNPDLTFHNFGTSGYDSRNALAVYEAMSSTIPHDLVILSYFLGNDLRENLDRHNSAFPDDTDQKTWFRTLKNINAKMRLLSRSYNLLYAVLRREISERRLSLDEIQKGIKITDEILTQIVTKTQSNRADLLIFVIPSWNQIKGYRDPEEDLAQRSLIQTYEAGWDHVHVIDMTKEIEQLGIEPIYGMIDKHFSPFGYYTAARLIYDWIHSQWQRGGGGYSDAPAFQAQAAAVDPDCARIGEYREAFANPVTDREAAERDREGAEW